MDSSPESGVDEPEEAPPRAGRMKARAAALRARADRLADQAQQERRRHGVVDAAFEIVDHDSEIGGGIMAGALAYRLFIWLLPLALVAIAGLGFATDAATQSPEAAAKTIGLAGLVSTSISGAAESANRWYAVLIGVPVLL